MAIQETRTLPAPFIETLGEDYAKQLTRLTADPIDTSKFAPTSSTTRRITNKSSGNKH